MSDDTEVHELADLAYVFCKAAAQPIEAGHLPYLRLQDVVDTMWDTSNDDLLRLWAYVGQSMPNEKNCALNSRIVGTLPRESLAIAEIFAGALRSNLTDKFLARAIPPNCDPVETSSKFLAHAAPHLANIFYKPVQ